MSIVKFNAFAIRLHKLFMYLCHSINTMKAFACILSLYILILTAIPCIDVPQDQAAFQTELSQTTTHNCQNGPDTCSPFCVCNCCVSPITPLVYSVSFTCYSITRIQFNQYTTCFSSNDKASIWQPPKVC